MIPVSIMHPQSIPFGQAIFKQINLPSEWPSPARLPKTCHGPGGA